MSIARCLTALLVACALLHGAAGDPVKINSRIWKCTLNATQMLSENAACNLSILTNGSSVTLAPKSAM